MKTKKPVGEYEWIYKKYIITFEFRVNWFENWEDFTIFNITGKNEHESVAPGFWVKGPRHLTVSYKPLVNPTVRKSYILELSRWYGVEVKQNDKELTVKVTSDEKKQETIYQITQEPLTVQTMVKVMPPVELYAKGEIRNLYIGK